VVLVSAAGTAFASEVRNDFSADPGWEGFRNRLLPAKLPRTKQDFGYRPSNYARGAKAGEVGGWIQRSMTPATYAKAIAPKTLKDRLTASGRFTVTNDLGNSGVLFGWFHETSRGWRTPNSLCFRIDGNEAKYWVFFEYGTRNWLTGGGVTFEGERYQTTPTKPFRADGTPHDWSLTYEPEGNNGDGEIILALDGKSYSARVLPGHKDDGAEFNRFGFWNMQASGNGLEMYVDDLVIDGVRENFDSDPGWIGVGNKTEFAERAIRPLHDFGYSQTRRSGGEAGEIGGLIWRDEAPAYYAARTEKLSLTNELYASGKLAFTGAGSDSAVYFGWFDSASKTNKNTPEHVSPQTNLLAILIEGPSRVGHHFRPVYATANGKGVVKESGPLIKPDGRVHQWSMRYRPKTDSGAGEITVTLDGDLQWLEVRPEQQEIGATFDRFGFFNLHTGGHFVEVYVDDLTYGSGPGAQP
jgi:hypothetical protein